MIIAVIADTHLPSGKRRIPHRCMDIMSTADLIVHAGDIVTGEVLEELEALGPPVEAIHGNMDSAALRKRLPAQKTIEIEGASLGLVHDGGPAAGRLERLRRRFSGAGAVVFGHSHMPLHESKDDFQIFNPGSPTARRRSPDHTMGIARVEAGSIGFRHVVLD
jgi:putative phosphoesterase